MAGDWIKMRADLFTHPKVFRIAEILGKDELYTVGALFCFWAWADKHCVDGLVDGATSRLIDRATRVDGLSDALMAVGWLEIDNAGAHIPRFGEHNGDTAKERSLKNQRQARWRAGKTLESVDGEASTSSSTKASTREEKRREEKEPNGSLPPTPEGLDLQAWDRWQEYRRQIKKPIKPASAPLAMKSLAGYGANQAAVVEQSIANGWQGLFDLKGSRAQVNRQEAVEQRNRSVAEQWLADAGEAHETV